MIIKQVTFIDKNAAIFPKYSIENFEYIYL